MEKESIENEKIIKDMKEFILSIFNSLKNAENVKKFIDDTIQMLKEATENENEQKITDILVPIYEFLQTFPDDEIKLLSDAFLYLNKIIKYEIVNGNKVLKRYSLIRFYKEFLIDETSRKLLVLTTKLRLTPYSKQEERKDLQSKINEIKNEKLGAPFIKHVLRDYMDENGDITIEFDEMKDKIREKYNKEVSIEEIKQNFDELQDIIAKKQDEKNEKEYVEEKVEVEIEEEDKKKKKVKPAKVVPKKIFKNVELKKGINEQTGNDYNIEYSRVIFQQRLEKSNREITYILNQNVEGSDLKVSYEEIQKQIYEKFNNMVSIDDIKESYKELETGLIVGYFDAEENEKELQKLNEELEKNRTEYYETFISFLKSLLSMNSEMEILEKITNFINTNKDKFKNICRILNIIKNNYNSREIKIYIKCFLEQDKINFYRFYEKFGYVILNELDDIEKNNNDEEEEVEEEYEGLAIKNILTKMIKKARMYNIYYNINIANLKNDEIEIHIKNLKKLIRENKHLIKNIYASFKYHLNLREFLLSLLDTDEDEQQTLNSDNLLDKTRKVSNVLLNSDNLSDANIGEIYKKIKIYMEDVFIGYIKNNEAIFKKSDYYYLFDEILKHMEIKSVIRMIGEYLNQYELSFNEYYIKFLKDNNIKEINKNIYINNLICNVLITLNEKEWDVETQRFIRGDDEDICGYEAIDEKDLERHKKEVHINSKIEKEEKIDINIFDVLMYKNRPWITGLIKKTYILNVVDDTILDFNNYIVSSDSMNIDDKTWYSVNDKFFHLETNKYMKKAQIGNILFFYDKDNTCILQIYLGFLMEDNNFIQQDENIYNSEMSYIETINGELNEFSVKKMLERPLTDSIKKVGHVLLSRAFSRRNIKYSATEILQYIDNINLTTEKYAQKIGEIIVYIDINNICDNIFEKRLLKKYYNVKQLFNLTIEDKIPEILCNDEEYVSKVLEYMDNKLNEFVYKFGENVFITSKDNLNYQRKKFEFIYNNMEEIKYESVQKFCNNSRNDVEDLIIYKENDHNTCINIKDLLKHIYNDKKYDYFPKNISSQFYEKIKKIYSKSIIEPKDFNVNEYEQQSLITDYLLIERIIYDINKRDNSLSLNKLKKQIFFKYKEEDGMFQEDEEDIEDVEDVKDVEEDVEDVKDVEDVENVEKDKADIINDEIEDGMFNKKKDEFIFDNDINEMDRCQYCDNICKKNERVSTIKFSDKRYKKLNFEVMHDVCLKCLNEINFDY